MSHRVRQLIDLGSPPPAWDYTDLPGLDALFKAEIGLSLSGSDVTSWADQSGAGICPTLSNTSDYPTFLASGINGLPDVSFSASLLDGSSAVFGTSEITVFCIFQTSNATAKFLFGMHFNNYHYGLFINIDGAHAGELSFSLGPNNDRVFSGVDYSDGRPHCAIVTSDGTTLAMYVDDGVTPVATTPVTGSPIAPGSGDINTLGAEPGVNAAFIGHMPIIGASSVAASAPDLVLLMTKLRERAGTLVTGVSPAIVVAEGGETITITGTGLAVATGATCNGVALTSFSVSSDTTITGTFPGGTAIAGGDIVVHRPSGDTTLRGAWNVLPAGSETFLYDEFMTLSGSTLTAWPDQSGHGNDPTVNGAPVVNASNAAFNNRPTVTLDGVDDSFTTPTLGTEGYTFVIIASNTNANGYFATMAGPGDYWYAGTSYSAYASLRGGSGADGVNAGGGYGATGTPGTFVLAMDGTHAGHTIRVNGVDVTTPVTTGDPGTDLENTTIDIGQYVSGGGTFLTGDVALVLLYPATALSLSDQQIIEQIARDRYKHY